MLLITLAAETIIHACDVGEESLEERCKQVESKSLQLKSTRGGSMADESACTREFAFKSNSNRGTFSFGGIDVAPVVIVPMPNEGLVLLAHFIPIWALPEQRRSLPDPNPRPFTVLLYDRDSVSQDHISPQT
jgi:hypothetical protein